MGALLEDPIPLDLLEPIDMVLDLFLHSLATNIAVDNWVTCLHRHFGIHLGYSDEIKMVHNLQINLTKNEIDLTFFSLGFDFGGTTILYCPGAAISIPRCSFGATQG